MRILYQVSCPHILDLISLQLLHFSCVFIICESWKDTVCLYIKLWHATLHAQLTIKRTSLKQRLFVRLLQLTSVYFCPSNATDHNIFIVLSWLSVVHFSCTHLTVNESPVGWNIQSVLSLWYRLMSKHLDILVRPKRPRARCMSIKSVGCCSWYRSVHVKRDGQSCITWVLSLFFVN